MRGRIGRELAALLEVGALCGLVIAQPLLDITGRAPDFFLFHGATAADILLLVAVITLGPPLLLWGLGAAALLAGERARRAVHLLMVGALCAALAVQAGKWLLPVRGVPLALAGLAAGLGAALAYRRWAAPGRLLRLAAAGPLVFVLLFVLVSPSSSLVRPALVAGGRAEPAGAGRAVGPHPPLVVIVLDELPQLSLLDNSGSIDAARFPNFARLAADATWYRNATAVRGFTPYAVPSMLTGRYPTGKAAPHYTQYPDNLFTLLGDAYELRVRESVVNLCPPELCGGARPGRRALPELLGQSAALLGRVLSPRADREDPTDGFTEPVAGAGAVDGAATPIRRPDDGVATFRWSRLRDNQPVRFGEFLADLRPAGARGDAEPTLHFLHLLLPHKPFRYLPSGMRYPQAKGLPESGQWWARLTRQRHLLQARYADRLLGEALDAMRDSGLYDRAAVVVTADHGIAFLPRRSHVRNLRSQEGAAEIGWVPLFVKAPGQTTARVDHRNVLQIDLLPTLADLAGMAVPWRTDGVSVLGRPRTGAEKPFAWNHGRGLMLDPRHAATVLAGPDDAIGLPDPPRQDLVGRAVAGPADAGLAVPGLVVADAGITATVPGLAAYRSVDPAGGTVPALVYGGLPATVPAGRALAVALNGRIGAVVPVLAARANEPRFAAILPDEALFRAGANRLELFLVGDEPDAVGGEPGVTRLERLRTAERPS